MGKQQLDRFTGEVAEWSIASDLKSDEAKTSGSSNLPLSVEYFVNNSSRYHQDVIMMIFVQLPVET
jgi:hypothetical protein